MSSSRVNSVAIIGSLISTRPAALSTQVLQIDLSAPRFTRFAGESTNDGRKSGKFFQMGRGQPIEHQSASRREHEVNHATVVGIEMSTHEPGQLSSVDELDDAVMTHEQVLGQFADRGRGWSGMTPDRQQQLMLLGRDPNRSCLLLAPFQKASQRDTDVEQLPILIVVEPFRCVHGTSLAGDSSVDHRAS